MSSKNAKRVRRLEGRIDTLEQRFDQCLARAAYESDCKDAARAKAHRDRQSRREMEAEYATKHWRTVAYAAIIAAILVLVVAISAIRVKAFEPLPPADELMISGLESATHPENDPKNTPVFVMNDEKTDVHDEIQEDFENEKIEAALLAMSTTIEDCTVTHYCICKECCGKDPDHPEYGITASGYVALPGITVAVDPDVIPLGSDVLVDFGDGEIQYFKADDTGSAVKGAHIDLCVATHEEAQQLGIKTATVYWVAPETL